LPQPLILVSPQRALRLQQPPQTPTHAAGPFLFADQLLHALRSKRAAYSGRADDGGGFREAVFYVEACESGSIFQNMLDPGGADAGVYAVTAASGLENSWATYCPGAHPKLRAWPG